MKRDYFDSLIERYKNNKLTLEEKELMERWLNEIDYSSDDLAWSDQDQYNLQSNIQEKLFPNQILGRKNIFYNKIAALGGIILISVLTGYYWLSQDTSNQTEPALFAEVKELVPSISNGVLIDELGKKIQLNTLNHDSLYVIDELGIKRISENEICILRSESAEVKMKHIYAPKGGGFTVRFEDNSRATLNANSSISFPSRFAKDSRVVTASGEIFFDVMKDESNRPFVVNAGDVSINVLGTKFNIQHKKSGSFKASLFQGLIQVNHKNLSHKITPGKEFIMDDKGNYSINDFSMPSRNAWKEGEFYLDDKNIIEIMEEIQDWYNVEVIYEDIDPNIKYKGSISKFSNVEAVLEILSLAEGNKFQMKERRIIVR